MFKLCTAVLIAIIDLLTDLAMFPSLLREVAACLSIYIVDYALASVTRAPLSRYPIRQMLLLSVYNSQKVAKFDQPAVVQVLEYWRPELSMFKIQHLQALLDSNVRP